MGRDEVLPFNDKVLRLFLGRELRQDSTHGKLDLLRSGPSDADVVLLSQVVDDVGRDLVPCDMDAR